MSTSRIRIFMLSIAVLSALMACSILEGTDREEIVYVEITQQPSGGRFVNSISCTYRSYYILDAIDESLNKSYNEPKGIDLRYWFTNDSGSKHSEGVMHLDAENSEGTFTLAFAAPAGMYLDKSFWAVFSWSDSSGQHTILSEKAVCTVN